jgi:CPA2 family monovalent cation:H+ antiporter-2
MRDAFSVIFFVSVGMLFDPAFLLAHPLPVAAGLVIVLVFKPLAALAIVSILGYPARTALTVALGLSQIGEFSFILAQVARAHGLMPDDGINILIATAMITITLNPLLFKALDPLERWAQRHPLVWKLLNGRAQRRIAALNAQSPAPAPTEGRQRAIIVGYGPVGRLVDALLRDAGVQTLIIDMNIDTVRALARSRRAAIYGDATRREVLEQAGAAHAAALVVTLPHSAGRADLVRAARELNPDLDILVRARYLEERDALTSAGANRIVYEEGEAGLALAQAVLERRALDQPQINKLLTAVRQIWKMDA